MLKPCNARMLCFSMRGEIDGKVQKRFARFILTSISTLQKTLAAACRYVRPNKQFCKIFRRVGNITSIFCALITFVCQQCGKSHTQVHCLHSIIYTEQLESSCDRDAEMAQPALNTWITCS